MNPEEYDRMYQLEDRYWWFVGRRNLALKLLQHFGTPSATVLDLGCGTGVVLRELKAFGNPIGLDMSSLALNYAADRGADCLVKADGTALPFCDNSFNAVLGLDVFEHIEHDEAALREVLRVLKPSGLLIMSVPAYRTLWGPHDVALHHFRRYTAPGLRKELISVGFTPVRISYSVFFLFPLVWLIRLLEKRRRGPAHASLPAVPAWLNRALIGLQNVEAKLIIRLALPWGSSVIAVAKKP